MSSHLQDNGPGGFSSRSHPLSSALGRAFPFLASRRQDQMPADWIPQNGHPEPGDNVPVRRRDLDGERDTCEISNSFCLTFKSAVDKLLSITD